MWKEKRKGPSPQSPTHLQIPNGVCSWDTQLDPKPLCECPSPGNMCVWPLTPLRHQQVLSTSEMYSGLSISSATTWSKPSASFPHPGWLQWLPSDILSSFLWLLILYPEARILSSKHKFIDIASQLKPLSDFHSCPWPLYPPQLTPFSPHSGTPATLTAASLMQKPYFLGQQVLHSCSH